MIDNLSDLLLLLIEYLEALGLIMIASKAITTLTPTQIDNQIQDAGVKGINILLRVLNVLSGNFGKDKNADDPNA